MLYPAELRAHPWQLHYFHTVTQLRQVVAPTIFLEHLEQHKQEHRTQRLLFPPRGASVRVPRPCGNRVPTSSAAWAPSKNCCCPLVSAAPQATPFGICGKRASPSPAPLPPSLFAPPPATRTLSYL